MLDPVTSAEGLAVLHLFCMRTPLVDHDDVISAVAELEAAGGQVVSVAILGHKAELAFMALHEDSWKLRDFQTGLVRAGLEVVDSYFSITELSEYAQGVPDEAKNARLYPQLPPPDKPAWCFYPMSKRRTHDDNWYQLDFDERRELMYDHGKSGRKFAGRIVQLITASTGLDAFEWGVTLFGGGIDDVKDTVYTMRFDEASARYAEFGPFYIGLLGPVTEVLDRTR